METTPKNEIKDRETLSTLEEADSGVIEAEARETISMAEEVVELPVSDGKDLGLPAHRELSQEEMDYFRGLMEAMLFVSPEALTLNMLARKCNLDRLNSRIIIDSLVDDYGERDSGIAIREIAGGYQFLTSERYSPALREIHQGEKREKLSRSTMEALAIISYKQPITLPEIDDIRGANTRPMISTLLQKKLIKPQGYKPVPGRPTLYVTTRNFLHRFALNSLAELPALEDVKELKFEEID